MYLQAIRLVTSRCFQDNFKTFALMYVSLLYSLSSHLQERLQLQLLNVPYLRNKGKYIFHFLNFIIYLRSFSSTPVV